MSAAPSTYADTVAYLQRLEVTAGWDLKLERMAAALALRGHPERRCPAVHVAGTNGKGSTAAMVDAMLRAAGVRTGLYTSPHLVDFCERIRAGGRTIPEDVVVALVAEQRAALDAAGLALTHFEAVTLLGLEWFARIGVDLAVVEVGLGGRLDATNLVEPIVTAITSIGLDHEAWLGHDVGAIAAEKAGILKPGVPLVLGPVAGDARDVILERAAAVRVDVVRVGAEARLEDGEGGLSFRGPGGECWDRLHVGLPGRFQHDNAAVALGAVALARRSAPIAAAAVRAGLASVEWPGRLAVVRRDPVVVVDGAHNPDGVEALVAELGPLTAGRATTLVFAAMADKNWPAMLGPLAERAARVIVTRVGRRGLDPGAAVATLPARVQATAIADPRQAVREAIASAGAGAAVVIAGSLFLAGEAYATLGGDGARLFQPWQAWEADATDTAP